MNTDGSFDGRLGNGAGATVLRDQFGQIITVQARWLGPAQEALVAERAATRDGLVLASQLGLSKVIRNPTAPYW